jgi:hypothetical protein
MPTFCNRCYRPVSATIILGADGGCNKCHNKTNRQCFSCEDHDCASPCGACYPDRLFRWSVAKALETGRIPGRFERRDFCKDCDYILCGCGEAEYSASVHNYIKEHGWSLPEPKRTSRPP